jgi:protocatechuate 4,5-dioxygenase alpha chain
MVSRSRAWRDYDDIPGTYVFDGEHSRKGYHLNMFCMSLNKAENRDEFRKDEAAYLQQFPMTEAQRTAVLERDWLGMLRVGGNIYYTFKIAIFDGLNMQQAGAAMSGNGTTFEEFQQMMLDGGRSIKGNRSKADQSK